MKGHIWYWFIIGPVFIAGIFIWLWTQGEATGTVYTAPKVEVETPSEPEDYTYKGKYLTLTVPGIFREATRMAPESGPLLESIFFVKEGGGNNEKIAVTVEQREEKTLQASPSYQMREANPLYSEQLLKEKRESFLTKQTDPFELSYFFFVDELLVSLTYSATASHDDKKSMLDTIKQSIQKTTIENEEKS